MVGCEESNAKALATPHPKMRVWGFEGTLVFFVLSSVVI